MWNAYCVGPGLSGLCLCSGALTDFSTLLCAVEDTKRNAEKRYEVSTMLCAPDHDTSAWLIIWRSHGGEWAGWIVVVDADLFTESFLFLVCFLVFCLPQWLHAEPYLWRKDLCVHYGFLFGHPTVKSPFCRYVEERKIGWPEHSWAAGLEVGYCHNRSCLQLGSPVLIFAVTVSVQQQKNCKVSSLWKVNGLDLTILFYAPLPPPPASSW